MLGSKIQGGTGCSSDSSQSISRCSLQGLKLESLNGRVYSNSELTNITNMAGPSPTWRDWGRSSSGHPCFIPSLSGTSWILFLPLFLCFNQRGFYWEVSSDNFGFSTIQVPLDFHLNDICKILFLPSAVTRTQLQELGSELEYLLAGEKKHQYFGCQRDPESIVLRHSVPKSSFFFPKSNPKIDLPSLTLILTHCPARRLRRIRSFVGNQVSQTITPSIRMVPWVKHIRSFRI